MLAIVDYGMGNVQSVRNAFEYLGASVKLTADPSALAKADHVVLPGVGAFRSGMESLNARGLSEALRELTGKRPLLGICLGMQLLAAEGDEGGATPGLGVVPGRVRRLEEMGLRIPHIGWNDVKAARPSRFLADDAAADYYFVHSYCFETAKPEHALGLTEYGETFPSVVGDDARAVWGVQFHPEKSHGHGLRLLKRFLEFSC